MGPEQIARRKSFDLGQHTGYASFSADGQQLLQWGTKPLGCSRKSCDLCKTVGASRDRFENDLELFFAGQSNLSVTGTKWAYEKVRRHKGVDAAHIYGANQSSLIRNCYRNQVEVIPVEVSTWKKKIGVKGPSKDAYIDRVNQLTGLRLELADEDTAAAIGVGLAVFCQDLTAIKVVFE